MPDYGLFDYDRLEPLDVQVVGSEERVGAIVQDITYASPKGGRVPAYLIMPQGEGTFPGLIFVHWGQGNRSEFVEEAVALTGMGFASLCLDAPFLRPGYEEDESPEAVAKEMTQCAVDARRAVDLFVEQQNIEHTQLGYVGHSYGATLGGILTALEKRIHSFVLMAGSPSLADSYTTSQQPEIVRARQETPAEEWRSFIKATRTIDAVNFVGYAHPAALLFQFARADEYVTQQEAEQYFAAASEPKSVLWYDGGHEFNAQARLDRCEWLCQQMQRGPLTPAVREQLGA